MILQHAGMMFAPANFINAHFLQGPFDVTRHVEQIDRQSGLGPKIPIGPIFRKLLPRG